MKVIIRTDASIKIGTGHVIRCLTIAKALRKKGCDVSFFMKPLLGNMISYIHKEGFNTVNEFRPVDLCIIDHYDIDIEWERAIRPYVQRIIVIDDLANRRHDCDILLDQNTVAGFRTRYDQLVPHHCMKLLGSHFLIMRDEFIQQRQLAEVRTGKTNRLLVFMGGSDPTNETEKALVALQRYNPFKYIDVVVGNSNPNRKHIASICKRMAWTYHCQIDYMATLMRYADFSIGAGGSAIWERCYVGLPASNTVLAENQAATTLTASELNAAWYLGWYYEVTDFEYEKLLHSLHERKNEIRKMSQKSFELTKGTEANPWLDIFMEVVEWK